MLIEEISIPKHKEKYSNQHMRSGVSKDLWIADKTGTRLQHHIESPHSVLTVIPHEKRIELVEQMIGMKCYFQEMVEDIEGKAIQNIRYLQSEEGTYRYDNHYFHADGVFLALYRLPGEILPTHLDIKDAYLKGNGEDVTLSFTERSPDFHAEKFKANMRLERNLK